MLPARLVGEPDVGLVRSDVYLTVELAPVTVALVAFWLAQMNCPLCATTIVPLAGPLYVPGQLSTVTGSPDVPMPTR
jgi:hypothetical protein